MFREFFFSLPFRILPRPFCIAYSRDAVEIRGFIPRYLHVISTTTKQLRPPYETCALLRGNTYPVFP
jgi:hypothetical protein